MGNNEDKDTDKISNFKLMTTQLISETGLIDQN